MENRQTMTLEKPEIDTVFRSNKKTPENKSVLLVSESSQLESLLEGVLDSIEARVVKTQPTLHAWRAMAIIQPQGFIIDLDIETGMGYNFLRELRQAKHALKFVAATSSDPRLEATALDCGADLFFENAIRPVIQLFSFFVATLGNSDCLPTRFDRVSRIRDDLFNDYMNVYQRLRGCRTDESILEVFQQIERLAWKQGDNNLMRATTYATRTGSTVWLSAYFQKCLGLDERAMSATRKSFM